VYVLLSGKSMSIQEREDRYLEFMQKLKEDTCYKNLRMSEKVMLIQHFSKVFKYIPEESLKVITDTELFNLIGKAGISRFKKLFEFSESLQKQFEMSDLDWANKKKAEFETSKKSSFEG